VLLLAGPWASVDVLNGLGLRAVPDPKGLVMRTPRGRHAAGEHLGLALPQRPPDPGSLFDRL
jgi:hypothetical protein